MDLRSSLKHEASEIPLKWGRKVSHSYLDGRRRRCGSTALKQPLADHRRNSLWAPVPTESSQQSKERCMECTSATDMRPDGVNSQSCHVARSFLLQYHVVEGIFVLVAVWSRNLRRSVALSFRPGVNFYYSKWRFVQNGTGHMFHGAVQFDRIHCQTVSIKEQK